MKTLFSFLFVAIFSIALTSFACSFDEPSNSQFAITVATANATAHATTHQDGGSDEMVITGLSGLLADDQHVLDSEVLSAISGATINPAYIGEYTLNGDININGKFFDAGAGNSEFRSTANGGGFAVVVLNDGNSGGSISLRKYTATPDIDDFTGLVNYQEYIGGSYHYFGRSTVVVSDNTVGSEDGTFKWYLMENGANLAEKMSLSSNGTLLVDGSFGTFDEYDDAMLLKQSIGEEDIQKLEQLGIAHKKYKMDDNNIYNLVHDGYYLDLQKMIRLLAGGVYQNREYIESLERRIEALEK